MWIETYRALLWPAAPVVAAWLAAHRKQRVHLQRFNPAVPAETTGRPIWVHACSVGEVASAVPLVTAMQARWPGCGVLLTVSTRTGREVAQARSPVPVAWFPLDHPSSVSRFFARVQPSALVLVETELWPGVLACAHASGVPVVLASGRLSDTHARAYHRTRLLWRPVLRPVAAAAMQAPVYAERIAGLGVDPARIRVTGNIKFDAAPSTLPSAERAALRTSLGIGPDAPVLVFGSTRDGDEALAARCWRTLRDHFPGLRIVIAPRHLDRLEEVRAALGDAPHGLRSAIGGAAHDAPILVLDTHGELSRVYAIADVAIVCGSFYPGVDGHNPVEPAAQGVATVFGPHMKNFPDVASYLCETGSAIRVSGPEALAETLAELLADRERSARLGSAALDVVRANRGALARTLEFIAPALRLP